MNKNAIQKYAVWARNELIGQIKQRAFQYEISEKGFGDANAAVIAGRVLTESEKRQRSGFVELIKRVGYEQAVEEVAYTWFNRFVALRFMEVNNYLPTHVRVFSDANGAFNPEILDNVLHLDLPGLNKAKVSELINANATGDLYRYLLLTQCNALNDALPEMFERMGGYTEMLLPNNILREGSILERLVTWIPEDDWRDAVQIIGWMYQYYNTEPKQAVFDGLKKNIKITKEKIPAATQLFTPDWIVRYMVENSLGRLWLEGHPNAALKTEWKYYLDEAEQTPEVTEQLEALRAEYRNLNPEDIKVIDPCMGSGHILVYAFDVLIQIYRTAGYSDRDAAKLILQKNLYGLDIDRRAYQLAYFALMMKARQYNRRIFTENIRPHVYHPAGWAEGEEYGSLLKIDDPGEEPDGDFMLTYENDVRVWNFKFLLAQKYEVVVTNPPYMGGSGMSGKLAEFVKKECPDSKSDLFAAFIERGLTLTKPTGFNCMVTMQSWMFLSSFEKLRTRILSTRTITNLLHMENMVMGIAFGTAVSNLRSIHIEGYKGKYNHITMADIEGEKPIEFPIESKRNVTADSANFAKIPGSPVAYWVSEALYMVFGSKERMMNIGKALQGSITGDNDRFLRLWYEVSWINTSYRCTNTMDTHSCRWFPHSKGGEYRKWYGNNEYLINWLNDGMEIRSFFDSGGKLRSRPQNVNFFFKKGVTWSDLTSGGYAARFVDDGFTFNVTGPTFFPYDNNDILNTLGYMNSPVFQALLDICSPGLHYHNGVISILPYRTGNCKEIDAIVTDNVSLSRADWDAFETSWDFKRHPLV